MVFLVYLRGKKLIFSYNYSSRSFACRQISTYKLSFDKKVSFESTAQSYVNKGDIAGLAERKYSFPESLQDVLFFFVIASPCESVACKVSGKSYS
jgi:hypothetical protein